ncbi:potassium transporter TrkA [Micromonospora sp. NPDC005173]|uniref:potassium transporter TrkA n=1 Tax=Micromonospora sp. NPDC005173 TaxID=3157165 RepID=UPI0033BAB1C7
MDIERTTLPGIGVRHTFTTAQGRRIGIVEYRAGDRRDVIHDDPDDPDWMVSLRLTRVEAIALANLLGFPDLVTTATMAEPG